MAASRFDRFELLERLGAGGTGEVLLVRDGARRCALKRLLPHLEDDAAAAAFDREAALAARLRHPNVVELFEHGRVGGVRYLLMEYVDGKSLHQLLRACDRLPAGAAAFVVREVCRALAYVHALREDDGRPVALVHRDVSPSNVLLSRSGGVKLCDFGIARTATVTARTQPGFIKGKRGYLSPEQEAAGRLDARSDLFSAGVVLFEALTGQAPRAGGDRPSRLLPGMSRELDVICERALAPAPAARFGSADEMSAQLDGVVEALRGEAQLAACMERWCPARPPATQDPTRTRTLARLGGAPRWLLAAVAAGAIATTALLLAHRGTHGSAPTLGPPAAAPSPGASATAPPAIPPAAIPPPAMLPSAPAAGVTTAPPPAAAPARSTPPPRPKPAAAKRARSSTPSRSGERGRDYMPDPFHPR
jgi:hypothetical protein